MTAPTAFPETVRRARAALSHSPLDAASFARPLSACDVARCHGACCSDGAPLNAEEVAVLSRLAVDEAAGLTELGLVPDRLIAATEQGGAGHTGLRMREVGERSPRHPASVPDTACAALTHDGLCGFQVFAVNTGRHPWFWKPMICWLHPVKADETGIRLPPEGISRDQAYLEGSFASVTECSRAGAGAKAAAEILSPELGFLGELLGRDLIDELRAPV